MKLRKSDAYGEPVSFFYAQRQGWAIFVVWFSISTMGENKERRVGSFAEAGAVLEQQRREEVGKLYQEVMAGKFNELPIVSFKLEDIDQIGPITISPLTNQKPGEGAISFWFEAKQPPIPGKPDRPFMVSGQFYERGATGVASVELKKRLGLPFDQVELSRRILEKLKELHLPFYHRAELSIFPETDMAQESEGIPGGELIVTPVDRDIMQRLRFLESLAQGDYKEGFLGAYIPKGDHYFQEYLVYAWRRGVVVETPAYGNAAYLLPFATPLGVARPASKEQHEQFATEYLQPIFKAAPTRKTMLAQGGSRIVHHGNWEEKMKKQVALLAS